MALNRAKKKNADMMLKMKDKSEAVQKILFAEKKRVSKIEEEIETTETAIVEEEAKQKMLAERGQGHTTAVREAEMFRLKQLSILETRMARAKQNFSETEAGNTELRRQIDELRRLILCQKEVYNNQSNKLAKNKKAMEDMLYHADNVLYHKDIFTKRIEAIDDQNQMEAQDADKIIEDLDRYIENEAKNSKEFYERQMKSAPVFDDTFKETMIADIRSKAIAYNEERKTTVEIDNELVRMKDAFARLRDEAIGDQSLDEAIEDFNTVEGDCLKIMSHVRAKEVELEAEQQMETKLQADIVAKEASNEALSKKLEEVAVLRKQRDALGDEHDRLKREGASLKAQTTRWATALNNIFKAMSVDLEQLGVMGGRITADADLVRLMGVLEAKAERILSGFQKFIAKGGTVRSPSSSAGNSIGSALSATLGGGGTTGLKRIMADAGDGGGDFDDEKDGGGPGLRLLVGETDGMASSSSHGRKMGTMSPAARSSRGSSSSSAAPLSTVLPGGVSPAALSLPQISLRGMGGASVRTIGSKSDADAESFFRRGSGKALDSSDAEPTAGVGNGDGGVNDNEYEDDDEVDEDDEDDEFLAPMDINDLKRSFASVSLASLESF